MRHYSIVVCTCSLLFVSGAAFADRPWFSVCSGPCVEEMNRISRSNGGIQTRPDGYVPLFDMSADSKSDCEKDNAYELSKSQWAGTGTKLGCVYMGSRSQYILKIRNFGNSFVQCVAKRKDSSGDYSVVLVGAPRETDFYRCE